jgi:hypothetical protein
MSNASQIQSQREAMEDVIFVLEFICDRKPRSLKEVRCARIDAFAERNKLRKLNWVGSIRKNCLHCQGLNSQKFDGLVYDWLYNEKADALKRAYSESFRTYDISLNPGWIKLFGDADALQPIPKRNSKLPTAQGAKPIRRSGGGAPRQCDPLIRQKVEEAAIVKTTDHFIQCGFKVSGHEKDNLGWDLEATKDRCHLKLEVKGLSGSDICVELTPNV